MQYEESVRLGERLLELALRGLDTALDDIDEASWERVVRDGGATSREAVLADIGLGKRLPAVVARRLLRHAETTAESKPDAVVVIRGTEGMAVQLARCCRAIPGDAVVGSIKKGQGLVVHAADCRVAARSRRADPEQWIDVDWALETNRLYQAEIKATVTNQRGVLAKVASEIAEAGSNIDAITMEDDDRALYTTMHFVLEVSDRRHLARVMRALRRLPDVKKIARVSAA
jgi:(p)ppGpp synthase/HD superfamily hydrolase